MILLVVYSNVQKNIVLRRPEAFVQHLMYFEKTVKSRSDSFFIKLQEPYIEIKTSKKWERIRWPHTETKQKMKNHEEVHSFNQRSFTAHSLAIWSYSIHCPEWSIWEWKEKINKFFILLYKLANNHCDFYHHVVTAEMFYICGVMDIFKV